MNQDERELLLIVSKLTVGNSLMKAFTAEYQLGQLDADDLADFPEDADKLMAAGRADISNIKDLCRMALKKIMWIEKSMDDDDAVDQALNMYKASIELGLELEEEAGKRDKKQFEDIMSDFRKKVRGNK